MRVLLSGFEPQWGIVKTPSGELAKVWINKDIDLPGIEIRALVLPQVFNKSSEILIAEAESFKPELILMYGATQHESPIRIERFALNIIDTTMGDNSRIPIIDSKILSNGPPAYETNIPVKLLVEHLKSCGISAIPSYSAGTHTCNAIYYQVLHWLSYNSNKTKACFIHCAFPNEFGVIEDRNWETPNFAEIVRSSIETIKFLSRIEV